MNVLLYDYLLSVSLLLILIVAITTSFLFFYLFFLLYRTRMKWIMLWLGIDCMIFSIIYLYIAFAETPDRIVFRAAVALILTALLTSGSLLYVTAKTQVPFTDCEILMEEIEERE